MGYNEGMTFTRPIVGPKVYLSRGASGHAETFSRSEADKSLEAYLGNVKVQLAIEGFIRKMKLERRIDQWGDVLAFIADMTKLDVDLIPPDVAVSFWAQVDQVRDAIKRAKAEAKSKGN